MATEIIRPVVHHQPWYRILYVQVLIAIGLGVLIGKLHETMADPIDWGEALEPGAA